MKKLFSILLLCVYTLSLLASSGKCGASLTYVLDEDTGILTISGTGRMEGFSSTRERPSSAPWYYSRDQIKKVILEEGVTTVEHVAFNGCSNLTTVILPSSITWIRASSAFTGCNNLKEIVCKAITPPELFGASWGIKEIAQCTVYVPKNSLDLYRSTEYWKKCKEFLSIEGYAPQEWQQCEPPIITYKNGVLDMKSNTPSSLCYYSIDVPDVTALIKFTSERHLSVQYEIKAYAVAEQFTQSETVTATLCWLESDPKTEGINDITRLNSTPVLISSSGSTLNITGADNVNHIEFYNLSGSYLGAEQVINGEASFETNENFVIVKIGEKSIKVKK